MSLHLVSSALLLFACIAGASSKIGGRASWFLTMAGLVATGAGAVLCTGGSENISAPWPVYLGVCPLELAVGPFSALFILLLSVCGLCASLFSFEYVKQAGEHVSRPLFWSCFPLFLLGMILVLLAANAMTFLVFWEIMSLSSAALVAADLRNHNSQKAALIYLGATRVATGFIAAGFLIAHQMFGSWQFSDWHLGSNGAIMPALCVALGLCIKAGIWPFHIWLPYAHPAAPAPASALLSGVMIKVAFYALARFFIFDDTGSMPLALIFIFLGTVSSLWGVLFGFVQHDIKRILAYSTVENAGLILLGMGVCIYARCNGLEAAATIAFVAVLFHAVAHGLFKTLLFLSAGAVDTACHSRELDRLGGLAKNLPVTALCFLAGSCACACLPPLVGFSGKWLIYQCLFSVVTGSHDKCALAVSLLCMGTLALVGGLALAVFAKTYAVAFLGRPRSNAARVALEVSPSMRLPQMILALLCVLCGVASGPAYQFIASLYPGGALVAVPSLPLSAVAIIVLSAGILLWLVTGATASGSRRADTWECGYGPLNHRMQVSAESFSHALGLIFSPLLQYGARAEIRGRDRRHFPETIKAEVEMTSLLESRVYGPFIGAVRSMGSHFARLQAGSIHLYLLYVFVTLAILVIIGVNA